jgi:hypothetical protein
MHPDTFLHADTREFVSEVVHPSVVEDLYWLYVNA